MPISVMLKPSSSACNLRCEYCFYSSLADDRTESFKGMMSLETAENVIKKAFDFSSDSVNFTFQGGEPLLRGVEFYENFISLVKSNNRNDTKVSICVQTNGTLINDDWCKLFANNGILVGVSLDGDEELNSYRVYPDGTNSFNDIIAGIELMQKYNVQFNVLSVLTSRLSQNIRKSYRFFKEHNLSYLQYIPCLNPFGEITDYAMSVNDYSSYLNSLFKIYFNDVMRGKMISIRQLDNYRLLAGGKSAEQCGMNGPCSTQFVVEGDGSVYPCDFYCTDEWLLGNINSSSFNELYESKKAVDFIKSSFVIMEECKTCKYFSLCRAGGCKRNRESADYCKAYKDFFEKSGEMIYQIRG